MNPSYKYDKYEFEVGANNALRNFFYRKLIRVLSQSCKRPNAGLFKRGVVKKDKEGKPIYRED
jgi:hypothetical protein